MSIEENEDLNENSNGKKNVSSSISDEDDSSSDYSERNFRRKKNIVTTLNAEENFNDTPNVEILDEVAGSSESGSSGNSRKRRNHSTTRMSSLKNFGFKVENSMINYFEKKLLANHPDIKNPNQPEIFLYRISTKCAQVAFQLKKNEDLSLLSIQPKPHREGTYQKITGSVLACEEMECGFFYNLIKTLTLEEIEDECSSFLHSFNSKKPELILFISKFEIQVSNLFVYLISNPSAGTRTATVL